jgi:hypothetical protein
MSAYFSEIIQRCSHSGILLDTNLLLLYFMGLYDSEQITRFKRTQIFVVEDFHTLIAIRQKFNRVLTTPNILTEVSNLAGQLTDKSKSDYFRIFAKEIQTFDERYFRSAEITNQPGFMKFGLTDIAISLIAQEKCLVLTVDAPLCQYLQSKKIEVLNFNHIRQLNWE